MKKIAKYFMSANVAMGIAMSNAMADDGLCNLITGLKPVIKTLRTLAFVGAAFVLMDWAWNMIKDPEKEATKDKIKDKGIGMFVGFFLLLGVGMVLHFVSSTSGLTYLKCIDDALKVN